MLDSSRSRVVTCRNLRAHCAHGFTLVELLVVIAIIGLLISITVPAVSSARLHAKSIGCQANLRNLFNACLAFSNDNKGILPVPSKTADRPTDPDVAAKCIWAMDANGKANFQTGVIWKYLGSEETRRDVVWCPGDNAELQVSASTKPNIDRNFSYSLNAELLQTGRVPVLQRKLKNQSIKIMFYEEVGPNDSYCLNPDTNIDDRATGRHGRVGSLQYGTPEYDTAGRGNFCFFDGHVESLSPLVARKVEHYKPIQ